MDVNTLGISFGTGIGLGLFSMFWVTAIFLPASYAMNRFVYHGTFMRIILGVIAGCGSIVSIVLMTIFRFWQKPIHYFGLLPIFESAADPDSTGFFSHPFTLFFNSNNGEDTKNLKSALTHLLSEETQIQEQEFTISEKNIQIKPGVINEELYSLVRVAGAIRDSTNWNKSMDDLLNACKSMFNQST